MSCPTPRRRACAALALLASTASLLSCERGRDPTTIARASSPGDRDGQGGVARRSDHPARAGEGAAEVADPTADATPTFVECAEERGLRFAWRSGHQERYLLPEITGGGVGLIDYDGDGDLDVYFVQGGRIGGPDASAPEGSEDRLFANDGTGRFADVTDAAGIVDGGYGMGVAVGDYDNDGDADLYVTNVGPNVLLRNDGGRFADATQLAGVGDPGWSTSAAFVDFDRDGDLDLYVCNYLNWSPATERTCLSGFNEQDYCAPSAYQAPARDTLYRNRGDGTFEDVTELLGIDGAIGTALGVTCGDYDGDGRLELFVANDAMMNHLWAPRADGVFEDVALARGCATGDSGEVKAGMGVASGDLDHDGDLDLLVVNLRRETDSLFLNDGRWFRDATAAWRLAGPTRRFTRFGVGFADFDHDGQLDLYQANGRVQRYADTYSDDPYAEPNLLLRGVAPGPGESGRFEEWLPRGGTAEPLTHSSRGAAFGDLDGDGALDVVVVNRDAPAYLLRNVRPDRGNWLLLRVRERCGRDALGAEVRLMVGDRTIRRDVLPACSYCASNDPRVHVGLGAATRVDAIEVRWADGAVERFPGLDAGQVAEIRRP